jgi:hypothetical protein
VKMAAKIPVAKMAVRKTTAKKPAAKNTAEKVPIKKIGKKSASKKPAAKRISNRNCMKYRARVRVRFGMGLTSDEVLILTQVAGRTVEIKSQEKGKTLRGSEWIIFSAGGFGSEAAAQSFGENLCNFIGIAGVCTRIGVDVGENNSTGWIDEEFARAIGLIGAEDRVYPNVHGLIVVPDDGHSKCVDMNITAAVTADPVALIESLTELGDAGPVRMASASAGIGLLNLALLAKEPLTQTVLAVSAVEALGQGENWTDTQKAILEKLAYSVENEPNAGAEQQEIADALRRSIHRIGLRQGVLRVLSRLGLDHLRKEWDRLYGLRSGVFHGTAQLNNSEMSQLGYDAITLCGKIIVSLLRSEGVHVPSVAAKHY